LIQHDRLDLRDRRPEDLAWLFYTSGTTGRPKGAMLTHRNLLNMCHSYFADVDPGAPWQAIAHAAPMSHGSGLYAIAHVAQGSCHVIPASGGFDAREIYTLIERWPGLCIFAAPTMLKRLLDDDPGTSTANLKIIMYGGGPMYVEDSLRALDRFGPKLSQLYGQGESPMTITALGPALHAKRDHPRWLERLGSVGKAQSVVEVRVAGAADRPLAVGEVGEILVRGDSVMAGYWQNEQASKAALAGGWLHTGDVGSFDEDGFLTLKDRIKDMIITGGSNIYPREVEEVLLRHPQVSEASVIGRRDRDWGEVVVAYVVPKADCELDRAALDAFCIEHMARFKRPKDYRSIDALPKNNYGKVLKTALRELDAREAGGAGEP
ncbi:MAG: AMP-binding protein, partial [Gammaproteobacteria bacterium]